MLIRGVGIVSLVAAIVLSLLLTTTTPSQIGPLGILVVFFCMYLLLWGGVVLLLIFGHRSIVYLLKPFTVRRPMARLSTQRAYYLGSVIALGPVIILAMQSVGGADMYGVLLTIVFVVIGCVYITKRTA